MIHTIMAESKISVGDTSACNSRSCSEKDGTKVNVVIGEKEEDPVFAITDLLPHLGSKQMEKTAATVIEGEALDILVGSAPLCGEEKDAVAANVLKLLKETYSMEKEDLMSAELEIVPAGKKHVTAVWIRVW